MGTGGGILSLPAVQWCSMSVFVVCGATFHVCWGCEGVLLPTCMSCCALALPCCNQLSLTAVQVCGMTWCLNDAGYSSCWQPGHSCASGVGQVLVRSICRW
jgi:hypothetical protein